MPAIAWSGVRSAQAFAPDCAAPPEPNAWIGPAGAQSEDCLYLNIWRPAKTDHPLPVLMWIYGGGFTNGGTSPAIYDGSNLARKGVILVSINYRVGQFGFFAHPALAHEQADKLRGNYGFLDQIAALKWIRANIAAFGGDPKNVTAFGESAGGFSVHMLLISPLARGLIDKAIIESGGGRRSIMYGQRMDTADTGRRPSAEDKGLAWAKTLGIPGTGPDALAKLRALPTAAVVNGMNFVNPLYCGPMIDGTIMPSNMMTAYENGRFAHIPIMIGTTSGDMSLNFSKSKDDLFKVFGDQEALARSVYDPAGNASLKEIKAKEGVDEMMHETARFTARQFARDKVPVYLYRFGYVASVNNAPGAVDSVSSDGKHLLDLPSYGAISGAYHTTEIPFVFDNLRIRYGNKVSAADVAMANMMSSYWVSFARTGSPDGPDRPRWTPATSTESRLLVIDNSGTKMILDPIRQRLDVAETLNAKTAE